MSGTEIRERARLRAAAKRARPGQLAIDAANRRASNAAQRGKTNAMQRQVDNRRAGQREFFSHKRQAADVQAIEAYSRKGVTVLNTLQLRRPLFIVELRGQRRYERWPESTEDTMAKAKPAPSETQIVHALGTVVCLEADRVEERAEKLAERTGCPASVILDALTIELTGRFIGRVRERDVETLKHQLPI